MAEKIVIAELELNTKALQESNTKLIQDISRLREVQKGLKKETGNLTNATEEQRKKFTENDAALKKLSNEYSNNKKVLAENTTGVKGLNNALSREISSLNQAKKNNKELINARNQVNTKTLAGQKAIAQINQKLDKNNKLIKDNSSNLEQQKIGIGGYEQGIANALNRVNFFGVSLGSVYQKGVAHQKGLIAQRAAMQGATKATSLGSKALNVFRIALISTGIAAIVVLLGSLVSYLTTTQKGIDTVTKVTKPLQVIFSRLQGVLQVLGKRLFDTFSNPKQAIKDLWKTIKENIVNRITGIADTFKFLGKTIKATLSFKFSEAKENAKALGESVTQVLTGIDDLPNKIKKGAKQTANFFKESIQTGNQLRQIGIDIENSEARLVLTRQKLTDQIKEQELISKDTSKTVEERNTAINKALQLSKELSGQEKNLINLKIKQEKIEQSLNDSGRADLKKLNELKAQAIAKDTEQRKTELRFLGAKNSIAKESAKIAIDNANRELQIFKDNHQSKLEANTFFTEELLKQENLRLDTIDQKEREYHQKRLEQGVINQQEYNDAINTVNEENRIAKEESQALRDEAKKEKEIIDLENQRAIDEENFLNEFQIQSNRLESQRAQEIANAQKTGADVTKINEKFDKRQEKLEEVKQQNIRQGYANTFGQLSQLLGESSAAGKAFAIAQATIQGYEAVLNAYATAQKSPITVINPAYPIIQAGIAGAFGAAQIANIAGVKFEKGGLQEIGGKRHLQGGTKFIGEDGTAFEAEQGELIGVMNRNAARLFMEFNNTYSGGLKSQPNVFAGGAILQRQVQAPVTKTATIDYDLLANKIADANKNIPPNTLNLEYFNESQSDLDIVISGASR